MPRKILIVEPSVTVQQIFSEHIDTNYNEVLFAASSEEALKKIADTLPLAVFINAELPDADGYSLARLLKNTNGLQDITQYIYSTNKVLFDEYRARVSGASRISLLENDLLEETLQFAIHDAKQIELPKEINLKKELENSKQLLSACRLWNQDVLKNAIMENLFSLIYFRDSSSEFAKKLLSLASEISESPLVALCVTETEKSRIYYIAEETVPEQEVSDFLQVCVSDFEKIVGESGIIIKNKELQPDEQTHYYSDNIELSSYKCLSLNLMGSKLHATLNIVRQGNLSLAQESNLLFLCENAGSILENSLFLKRKINSEDKIRKAFSRFVPAEIIDDLASRDEQTNISVGETRQIAILFCDIRSFTDISERNKPETVVAFLNRYFSIMVEIIKKYGGAIDKFMGDAIMAEFGATVSYDDNSQRAVRAAYEMREALPTIPIEDLILPDGMKFDIGIGIHYGDAIVGSIGSKDKTDFSVIGDAVNLASRLEGLTKKYGVQLIVSEAIKTEIYSKGNQDGFYFRHLDNVRVKGKKNAVPIYAIDRSEYEYPEEYCDAYKKGMDLYKQGTFRLAKEYFEEALKVLQDDKASKLMLERCEEFIERPPENWDGAISYETK